MERAERRNGMSVHPLVSSPSLNVGSAGLTSQSDAVNVTVGEVPVQPSLFATTAERVIQTDNGYIRFTPSYVDLHAANELFEYLKNLEGWRQDFIRVYGK